MGKSIGVHEILKNTYDSLNDLPGAHGEEFPEEWVRAIGLLAIGFKMIVWGPSGNGKTTFVMKLCKALSKMGRVYYNSKEEGDSRTIQRVLQQCDMHECKVGSFVIGDRDSFEEMVEKLGKKRQKTRFVVVDSIQHIHLRFDDYVLLKDRFPHIGFIFISHEDGSKKPQGQHAKSVRYAVDIKTYVEKGVAVSDSRYGPTMPFRIMPWADKTAEAAPPKQPKAKVETGQLELIEN